MIALSPAEMLAAAIDDRAHAFLQGAVLLVDAVDAGVASVFAPRGRDRNCSSGSGTNGRFPGRHATDRCRGAVRAGLLVSGASVVL